MSFEERESLSKYGSSFQEKLCYLILTDRAFADQIFEVLDVGFLELKYLRVFISEIKKYRKKYKVHPTSQIMQSIIRTSMEHESEAIKKRIREYYARVLAYGDEIEESLYVKDTALDFCRKQKLKEALIKSVDLIKKSSFDEVASVINEAIKLGSDNDFGYDYLKDFELRFMLKARNPVTSGWKKLDDILKGGLGSGELGVVIAPTGAGKSMVLVHLGAQALKEGLNVVHYTLELADTIVAQRYDSCLTERSLNQMVQFKDDIYKEIKEIPGRLIVKEYPTRFASIQTIKNHLEKLSNRAFKPNLILVDYGDLIKPPPGGKDEKRHQLETIYEELRGIAQIYSCPIWTASQTNRSGLNAEVITMESISEAFNKCFVADVIFTVSRTVEDKNTNAGRIFIAKNRNGPDGLVYPIFMDTSTVKIKILEKDDTTVENLVQKVALEQKKRLQEKYKKFRK